MASFFILPCFLPIDLWWICPEPSRILFGRMRDSAGRVYGEPAGYGTKGMQNKDFGNLKTDECSSGNHSGTGLKIS
jgi:hypothetical protein